MKTIIKILNKIGLSEENDNFLLFNEKIWKKKIPIRLQRGLIEIKPHSFLLHENKIIAMFFLYAQNEIFDVKALFKKIWNLGGSPIIFIITESEINIYNGFSFDAETSFFDKLKIGNEEVTINNIDNNLSIWDIITGRSFENLKKPKTQVDEKLLENLESTKNILEKNGLESIYAQNIIGRLIFSRYLLDRNVKIESKYFSDKNEFLQLIKNKKLLYEYFHYLKETFNGDLFPVKDKEISQITEIHLEYLHELFSGSDISDDIIQKSLFEMYDFNIIPIELISEVYERFIGKNDQKKNAAYYTPSFLVDYILEKTVKLHLNDNNTCKVFDPSCGSGIFLVESLRAIIEKNLDKKGIIQKEKLKKLLTDNIFGSDIDEKAINLTVFSLCLTLLDYIEPKDVTAFKFPHLLNKNLFNADFFDTKHLFNNNIKNLDFIIGNPPWGSDKENNNPHIQYFQTNQIPVSDKQIAQSFVARTKDFSRTTTKCAMVLPSKPILYNHNAYEFRQYFLNNFYIKEILELSPVRNQIFSGAVAPTAIVFYNYSHNENTNNNVILHTSIKPNIFFRYLKIIVIEKNDIKQIKQHYFKNNDYLWKIMLYGNVLDFYLIKRLKEDYENLNQVVEKNNLSFGQGFTQRGKFGNSNTDFFINKKFLDTKLWKTQFYINNSLLINYDEPLPLYRPGIKAVPPYVLLKRAFSKQNFSFVSMYSENDYVFSNLITAISGKNKSILKAITGILNSIVHSYFLLLQGASSGVEREESFNEERFQFPFIFHKEIVSKVDTIQMLYLKFYSETMHNYELESQIKSEEAKLNKIILDSFELSDLETSLIDYAIQITIPQINNKTEPMVKTTETQLKEYAQIFIDHFSKRWNGDLNYFAVEIYYNNYIVGMNFKVTDSEPKHKIEVYPNKKAVELLQLIQLGEEKITDVFYKQRDIRGFNESSFYVLKPNQYKNWHPAIAHGDLTEFIEAMLQTEKRNG